MELAEPLKGWNGVGSQQNDEIDVCRGMNWRGMRSAHSLLGFS